MIKRIRNEQQPPFKVIPNGQNNLTNGKATYHRRIKIANLYVHVRYTLPKTLFTCADLNSTQIISNISKKLTYVEKKLMKAQIDLGNQRFIGMCIRRFGVGYFLIKKKY